MLSQLPVRSGCVAPVHSQRCCIALQPKHPLGSGRSCRNSLRQLSALEHQSRIQSRQLQQTHISSETNETAPVSDTAYASHWQAHAFLTLPQDGWEAIQHMSSGELESRMHQAEQEGQPLPTIAIDGNAAARWMYPEKEWERPMSPTMRKFLEQAGKEASLVMCDSAIGALLLLAPPLHRTRSELMHKLEGKGIKIDNLPLEERYSTVKSMEDELPTMKKSMDDQDCSEEQLHLRDAYIINHAVRRGAILVTADSRAIACPSVETCWDVLCSA